MQLERATTPLGLQRHGGTVCMTRTQHWKDTHTLGRTEGKKSCFMWRMGLKTVRISYIGEQGDTTGICCQQIKISHPQTRILIRDFNYSGMSWKGSKVEHKTTQELSWVWQRTSWYQWSMGPRDTWFCWTCYSQMRKSWDVKANGSLGCSYHELVEFRILREARWVVELQQP